MSDPVAGNSAAQSAEPKQLIVAVFPDEETAVQVLAAGRAPEAAQEWEETAILRREDDGRLSVREQNDLGMAATAGAGALAGGLLGALFGRAGLGALLGGATGAAAAYSIDAGISDARLQELADALVAGTSALAAIVPDRAVDVTRRFLEGRGGAVMSEPIQLR